MKRLLSALAVILITAAVLLLAVWLPRLFYNDGQALIEHPAPDTKSPVGIEKSEYLGRALSSSEEFVYESVGKVDSEQRYEILEGIFSMASDGTAPGFLLEEMESLVDTAVVERLTISTVGGAKLSLIHCYHEWKKDWSNWLDAYIDEETGKILYIYLSGKCLNNGPEYAAKYPEIISLDDLRDEYTSYMGYTMADSVYSQNPNQNALTAIYTDGSFSVKYLINRIYYAGTMYDIKIAPQP